jgi:23S rRNA pseudouridine955/2504/2580 synthase
MLPFRLRVGTEGAGMRADVFVSRELPGLSRTRIRQKIQTGEASLNGKRFATSTRLREGDEILVPVRSAAASARTALPCPELPVLFEDEHLLAVDKPAGIATHPMGRMQAGTVIHFARQRLQAEIRERLRRGDSDWFPRPVNRLDVFTSGVVVLALTRGAQKSMQELLLTRSVYKEYIALVEGVVEADTLEVTLPLGFDPASAVRVKMASLPGGRPSMTRIKVLRRLPVHTLLLAVPETGRQHQIRVHLAAIGHPVVGDLLYKDESLFLRYQAADGTPDSTLPRRHCLHASRIEFRHPLTGAAVRIESALPPDFTEMIAAAE